MRVAFFLLSLALLLVLPHAAAAQGFTASVKGGMSVTSLDGTTIIGEGFDTISRVTGGAGFGFDFGNGFVVQAEVLYVNKGGRGNSQLDVTPADNPQPVFLPIRATFDFTYIDVPLLLSYRYDTPRGFAPLVYAGPSLSFNQEAQVRFRALTGGPESSNTDNLASSRDFGLTVGFGVEVPLGEQRLVLEARTTRGRTNLRENDRELFNVAWLFMAGLRF